MNSLISINFKFMNVNPRKLVELIIKSKYTKGVEAYIDYEKAEEVKYLDDIVFELKKNNLILQIHGEVSLIYEKQLEFVKKIEKYSDYLGYPIVFTLHTIYDEDRNISLNKTLEYVSNLINSIDNNKVIVCLENLNSARGFIRLGKNDIRKMVLNDEKLFFTYDIGHELAEYGKIIDLDCDMIGDIRNIHIHSHIKDMDHMPIYKNDIYWNDIIKGLTFLSLNKYNYNIVFEYDLYCCRGNEIEDKIKDYLSSIDYVSNRF